MFVERNKVRRLVCGAVLAVAFIAGCRRDPAGGTPDSPPIDFYAATGIGQDELEAFLDRQEGSSYPVELVLQTDRGDVLADSRVIVRWDSGEYRLLVGHSGVVYFTLEKRNLPGLHVVAPRGFNRVAQRTLPLGTSYKPEEPIDTEGLPHDVILDGRISRQLRHGLERMRTQGLNLPAPTLQTQLRRTRYPVALETPPSEELSPAEIYRRCKRAVVIVASLQANGTVFHAGGCILDARGLVLTNYHVVDKGEGIQARGVMTFDGQMYPVREVLAADRPDDLALLRIEADGLTAAPLSAGDPEGTPVTVLSHPGSNYFSLTQGHISRYYAASSFGRTTVLMNVTADFAGGSSGAPIFNSRGAVTGLVSATSKLSYQMALRSGPPAVAIRRLVGAAAEESKE